MEKTPKPFAYALVGSDRISVIYESFLHCRNNILYSKNLISNIDLKSSDRSDGLDRELGVSKLGNDFALFVIVIVIVIGWLVILLILLLVT